MNLLKEHNLHGRIGGCRGRKAPLLTDYQGFKVGDFVRLKIVAVPTDHLARITSLNHRKEFKVDLRSSKTKDANGTWGPLWAEEIEKAEYEQTTH